jgi:hypothetical protein
MAWGVKPPSAEEEAKPDDETKDVARYALDSKSARDGRGGQWDSSSSQAM